MENHFKEVMLIWSNLANTLPDVGKPKKELHWQIRESEWFWKRTGTVEYAVCKPDLCHERGRAGCEKRAI